MLLGEETLLENEVKGGGCVQAPSGASSPQVLQTLGTSAWKRACS